MIYTSTKSVATKGALTFLFVLCSLFPSVADAALVAALNPASSGNTFIYDINFLNAIDVGSGQPSERLDGCGTGCNGTNGNPAYATVYDLFGVTSISLAPAYATTFVLTTQATGITPVGVGPTDGPLINFTVTYIGPGTTTPFSDVMVVAIVSSSATRGLANYTGEDTKNTGGAIGTIAANIGFITIPVASVGTPEPAVMFLIGSGLLGFSVIRR